MNKDQQKTVNEMLDAMELDTYGEKGLKEIIRQMAVEIVKQASQKRKPIFNYVSPDYITGEYLEDDVCNWNLTVGALKDCDHVYVNGVRYVEFQPEQTEQEPLAWLHEWVDETGETVRSIYHHFYEDANLIPLYTAPSKREPLSEDKLDALAEANITDEGIAGYYLGFRDAEKAHGITGGEE
jgi:hypothetical protein